MADMRMTKAPMPMQDAAARRHNFDEVALGYSMTVAREEAARCLNCKAKPCVSGCPVRIDIPAFLSRVKQGDEAGAPGSDLIQFMVRRKQRINACATRNCGQSCVKPSPSAERMDCRPLWRRRAGCCWSAPRCAACRAAHRSRRRARDFKYGASCVTSDTAHLLFPAAGCLWYNCISNHG